MMELERFYKAKQAEIDNLYKYGVAAPWGKPRPTFRDALLRPKNKPIAVIAEYKRASPSRGVICESLSPEDVARQYAKNGASAISVLTEEQYFHGDIGFLQRMAESMEEHPPLLRKDFIFDKVQVDATAATPASAMLLIVRLTPDARKLRDLREQAAIYGIASVVEVFNQRDLLLARESGAEIIQVNARDLETLRVDCEACMELPKTCPPLPHEIWIAASGMNTHGDLVRAANAGYHAALVGSALMEHGTPGESLRKLLGG